MENGCGARIARWRRWLVAGGIAVIITFVGVVFAAIQIIQSAQDSSAEDMRSSTSEAQEATQIYLLGEIVTLQSRAAAGPPAATGTAIALKINDLEQRLAQMEATAVAEQGPGSITGLPVVEEETASSPTPTAMISLPFEDQFTPGRRPEWEVLDGEAVADRGRLKPRGNEAVVLQLGDNLANVVVEFEYHVTHYLFDAFNDEPQVLVGLNNEVRFVLDSDDPSRWQALGDGRWDNVASGTNDVPKEGRIRIVFSGNVYETYVNDQLYAQASFGDPVSGPLQVRLLPGAWIAEFSIDSIAGN